MTARCLFATLLLLLATAAQAETPVEHLNRALTDQVVIPAYDRFAEGTRGLADALGEFCAAPAPASLAAARDAFAQAMAGWQAVQPFGFGPARSSGTGAVIELFPDPRGAVGRQLGKTLAAMDPALTAAGGLAGKSIALTGFPALERILYDDALLPVSARTPATGYACALAQAIARNLAGIAAGLLDDWQRPGGYRATMLTAGEGNDDYYDAEEAAKDLLKSLYAALDLALAAKLEEPLGETAEKARPKRLESWRSGLSLANIRANLTTARALYAAAGGFGDLLAAGAGNAALDQAIRQRFDDIFGLLDAIGVPLERAITEPQPRAKVLELVAELQALRRTVRSELAPALGLVLGFNATDGD